MKALNRVVYRISRAKKVKLTPEQQQRIYADVLREIRTVKPSVPLATALAQLEAAVDEQKPEIIYAKATQLSFAANASWELGDRAAAESYLLRSLDTEGSPLA